MVKRWQRRCKMKISVPWPSGEQVHRIDLAIKDYSVLWEKQSLKLTVDLERRIQSLRAGSELFIKKDLVRLQKGYLISPELIRRQPVQVDVTPDYLVMAMNGGKSFLEQGVCLHFSAWKKTKERVKVAPDGETLTISGRILDEEGTHMEMIDLYLPDMKKEVEKIEAEITEERFSRMSHGVSFQGKVLLRLDENRRQSFPVSILIPKNVPPRRSIEGKASINMVKMVTGEKVLLGIKVEWRIIQEEEELPVVVSPPGEDGCFSLCQLEKREKKVLTKELTVKLPESARVLEQVQAGEMRSCLSREGKGLLLAGMLDLDLFYISLDGQEKYYQTTVPFEEWVEEAAPREMEYQLKVNALRLNHPSLPTTQLGQELLLHLEFDYCLIAFHRREVGLPPPVLSAPTRRIFVEKIITHEPLEYYVEIPLVCPRDFVAGDQLWWVGSVTEGRAEPGAVLIKVEPQISCQYKNDQNQVKVVEFNPAIQWVHKTPLSQPGNLVRVQIDGTQMKLEPNSRGEFFLQLLLTGKLTIGQEEIREVLLSTEHGKAGEKAIFAEELAFLNWEEKLPLFPQAIGAAHFFLKDFRTIKMDEACFLEGEVGGAITYLDRYGRRRYRRITKEVWLKFPAQLSCNRVFVPVLSNWQCRPLPNWKWEQGGVWCELTLRLLSFSETNGKEVNK